MLANPLQALPASIVYPESDGLPMADNSKQFAWIVMLFNNLAALFHTRQDVFVSGNQFWYPEEGHPERVTAPDVYLVFGRPKGHRPSYKQWEEGNVPMTVVFEILSPGNTFEEMDDKLDFYEQYGVEEYYIYNPDTNRLKIFLRHGEVFLRERKVDGFVSPRLGIRFDFSEAEMVVYGPDNRRFLTFEEVQAARDQEKRRADRLVELLRKVRRGIASTEELQELDRLDEQSSADSP
jgi:Uma2 family endonuclease